MKDLKEVVDIITIDNGELFWVKMNDVKKRSGIKNMPDSVRKEINDV